MVILPLSQSSPAAMLSATYATTTRPYDIRFIPPNGTRLTISNPTWTAAERYRYTDTTHAEAARLAGLELNDILKAGIVRVRPPAGINVGAPLTFAQAEVIADDWTLVWRQTLYVDVETNHLRAKDFPVPINVNKLRAWVKSIL